MDKSGVDAFRKAAGMERKVLGSDVKPAETDLLSLAMEGGSAPIPSIKPKPRPVNDGGFTTGFDVSTPKTGGGTTAPQYSGPKFGEPGFAESLGIKKGADADLQSLLKEADKNMDGKLSVDEGKDLLSGLFQKENKPGRTENLTETERLKAEIAAENAKPAKAPAKATKAPAKKPAPAKESGSVAENKSISSKVTELIDEAKKYTSLNEFIKSSSSGLDKSKKTYGIEIPVERFRGKGANIGRGNTAEHPIRPGGSGEETVNYFMEKIRNGERPIVSISHEQRTFGSGKPYYISDGNHRFEAYVRLGVKNIPVHDWTGGKAIKKELTDIWNQAHSKALPEGKPLTPAKKEAAKPSTPAKKENVATKPKETAKKAISKDDAKEFGRLLNIAKTGKLKAAEANYLRMLATKLGQMDIAKKYLK
jgi:hypothetical protein